MESEARFSIVSASSPPNRNDSLSLGDRLNQGLSAPYAVGFDVRPTVTGIYLTLSVTEWKSWFQLVRNRSQTLLLPGGFVHVLADESSVNPSGQKPKQVVAFIWRNAFAVQSVQDLLSTVVHVLHNGSHATQVSVLSSKIPLLHAQVSGVVP